MGRAMSEPRPRRLRRKLALALGACLAPLIVAEIALRASGYDPLASLRVDEWRALFVRPSANPMLVYEPTPGARGVGWKCDIEINSHGFRDREYALAKPAGVQRVVALGDSITFGNMLPVASTWPEVVERLLGLIRVEAEVLNLGVGGYDTLEEVVFLEQVGLAFDPDVVVVGFCVNDLGTVSLNHTYIEGLARYRSWIYRSRLAVWVRLQLDRRSLVRGFHDQNEPAAFAERQRATIAPLAGDDELEQRMTRLGAELASAAGAVSAHPLLAWYASTPHVGHLRFALERLARLRDEHAFAVAFVLLPSLGEDALTGLYDQAYDIVLHEAQRQGFVTIDLREEVRALGGETLRIEASDSIHFDADGHLLIGRRVARELVERGIVER